MARSYPRPCPCLLLLLLLLALAMIRVWKDPSASAACDSSEVRALSSCATGGMPRAESRALYRWYRRARVLCHLQGHTHDDAMNDATNGGRMP